MSDAMKKEKRISDLIAMALVLTACGISEEDVEGTVVAAIGDFAATQTAVGDEAVGYTSGLVNDE